ncbi:glycoside hydrolase family 88/105 protein [Paenibacillus planticolens]|uniref:Glycosyl hydrolase n=1 Tax=Paenibacillus planticolens TaxID=2654976 RepID=A0ABX1ZW35_9BACL|nr:glycoside hydrolase family 88 protein [Paenibacillus planticolens]NOV04016.1 glycosyl hydrolase [Paenibacillus planticolens]
MNRDDLKAAAERVYQRMVEVPSTEWGMNLDSWDWVPGVGVISILAYAEHTQKQEVIEFLRLWTVRNHHLSEQVKVINSFAPYAIFPDLYRHTGDQWYLETAKKIGDWLLEEAPRTREGAFEHTVTEKASFPEQVWADTLFMAVLFLARLARLTSESKYAEEAAFQLLVHLRLLQDPQTGVLFHGWNCADGDHMSAARWTRANAWVVLACPWIVQEIESLVDISSEIPERYRKLAAGLREYQGEDGLWPTVLDEPEFYRETSGSAGIAAGWLAGIRSGWLDHSYLLSAQKALKGILPFIASDGTLNGVSGGTPVMPSIAAYQTIPCYPTLYGQGLALILLSMAMSDS